MGDNHKPYSEKALDIVFTSQCPRVRSPCRCPDGCGPSQISAWSENPGFPPPVSAGREWASCFLCSCWSPRLGWRSRTRGAACSLSWSGSPRSHCITQSAQRAAQFTSLPPTWWSSRCRSWSAWSLGTSAPPDFHSPSHELLPCLASPGINGHYAFKY